MTTGTRSALTHSSSAERNESRPGEPGGDADRGVGHRDRVPAERPGHVGEGDLALAGEVVDARGIPCPAIAASQRRRRRRRDGRAGRGRRCPAAPAAGTAATAASSIALSTKGRRPPILHLLQRLLDQHRRPPPGDDRRPEDVGLGAGAGELARRAGPRARPSGPSSRSPRCPAAAPPRSAAAGCRRGIRRRPPRTCRRAAASRRRATASNTLRVPSRLTLRVSSWLPKITKARWTATSAPSSSWSRAVRSRMSPWR